MFFIGGGAVACFFLWCFSCLFYISGGGAAVACFFCVVVFLAYSLLVVVLSSVPLVVMLVDVGVFIVAGIGMMLPALLVLTLWMVVLLGAVACAGGVRVYAC